MDSSYTDPAFVPVYSLDGIPSDVTKVSSSLGKPFGYPRENSNKGLTLKMLAFHQTIRRKK